IRMERGQTFNVAVGTLTVGLPLITHGSAFGDAHLSSFFGGSVLVLVLVEVVCDVLVVVTVLVEVVRDVLVVGTVLVEVASDVLVVVVWASAETAEASTIPSENTIILFTRETPRALEQRACPPSHTDPSGSDRTAACSGTSAIRKCPERAVWYRLL